MPPELYPRWDAERISASLREGQWRGRFVFHATTETEWAAASRHSHYRPLAFSDEGFTHCSTPLQVGKTLDRFYRGRSEIVLLVVLIDRLAEGALVWENLEGGVELFPHVYGPLPVASVVGLAKVALQSDGRFAPSTAQAWAAS